MQKPFQQFSEWLEEAKIHPEIAEPTAMTLATATLDGIPSARVVLLKGFSVDGFVFYTNLTSRKGEELKQNPHAALCFYWMKLDRQIRIEGMVAPVSTTDADAYFASRSRDRQIGAWASLQSQPLQSRAELDARVAELELQYANKEVPRPPHWSGWRLVPKSIEFWHQNWSRLHEREIYTRDGDSWKQTLLYP